METKVQIDALGYAVPSREILTDVCLRAEKGQFVGLIGPNGSGKTTLLKHIYRALPPQKKTVYLNGREIERYTYRETAQQVTVMRQENESDFDYTILEMVLMGRSPYRRFYQKDTREDKQIAMDALRYVGMDAFADRCFSTLSGGEKQRVLIARSLAQQADILVLDEPTNHLDVHYQWLIMETIAGLGKTVISVFHELNLTCAFCDYVYVLKEGRIVAQGPPQAVCTARLLADVFRIDAEVLRLADGRVYIVYKGAIGHAAAPSVQVAGGAWMTR